MTSRIFELQELQKISVRESAIAVMLLDESVPMNLHAVGLLYSYSYWFLWYINEFILIRSFWTCFPFARIKIFDWKV